MSSACRKAFALALAVLAISACEREARDYEGGPASARETKSPSKGDFAIYEKNAFHLSEGKRLFTWFNCTGCHGNGGGGSGPVLIDNVWLYGDTLPDIAETIRHGRPNGMPAFGDKIAESEIWQLAGYVRALTGEVSKAVAPSRNDDLMPRPSENRPYKTDPNDPTRMLYP
jgi:cytochrome c oxidase cbb3-type subunit 3